MKQSSTTVDAKKIYLTFSISSKQAKRRMQSSFKDSRRAEVIKIISFKLQTIIHKKTEC